MPRVLLVDNYDSFTYNLEQALRMLGAEVWVARNDEITLEEAEAYAPSHLVISPGPGRPENAGVSMGFLQHFIGKLPVLGVCLGHQAIGAVLRGTVTHAPRLMHGKSSPVYHDGVGLYAGLSNPFEAARYHSLIVQREDLPDVLEVAAYTAEGEIMGLRHRQHTVVGVQFHPESVLTGEGNDLLANFLRMA